MSDGTLASPVAQPYSGRRRAPAIALSAGSRECLLVVGIVGLGALLRLPNLQTLPKLTDEMRDAIFSLEIARGQAFPLANFSSYDGALFNYLQAALFRLVGPDLEAPRVLMLWFGLATLPLAYLCVHHAYGPDAGLLAALMLAVSPVHVLVNSHVAWGNCMTPLLTTPAFWLVYRATRAASASPEARTARRPWELAPAGLLFGLALQTHPTVGALLPGVVLAVLLTRPGVLRSAWPWLGLAGFALGYANMLVFNLQHDFESIAFAQQTRASYTGAAPDFGRDYLIHFGSLLLGLFRMIGGAVEDRGSALDFLSDPLLLAVGGLALAGLLWAARRRDFLPLLVVAGDALLLPVVNDRYEPVLDGRYLAPLLPLVYGAMAGLLVELGRRLERRPAGARRWPGVLAIVLVAGVPLLGLVRYAAQNDGAAQRSARLWTALQLAEANRPPDAPIVLDRDLDRTVLGAGSTEALAFEYAFLMHDVAYRKLRVTPGGLAAAMANQGPRLVVIERAKRKLLDPRLRVRQLAPLSVERTAQPFSYGVYLVSWEPDR